MQEAVISPLPTWQNFYVIVGSSAAALTGLMFIVITLIAGLRGRRSGEAIAAFSTPNVVHFCAALFIAVTMAAPWQVLWNTSFPLGLAGVAGMIYIIIIVRRTRRQNDYQPVMEDWIFHTILPLAAYTTLLVAAIVLPTYPVPTLFVIGAMTVLLIFIGIHNAWDNITYIVLTQFNQSEEEK
jgi:hypothetical protein